MNQEQVKNALDEYFSCVGMVSEAKSKLLLLKNKVQLAEKRGVLIHGLEHQLEKIKIDLNKYTYKLRDIFKELLDHGIIS